jgi:ribosomal protein S18 acetylase RimI-like enzyme
MSTYEVFGIPVPPPDEYVAKYKDLRLFALKKDPAAFSTTYEEALLRTPEYWRGLIDCLQKVTFIAHLSGLDGLWVGLVTIIEPEYMKEKKFPVPPGEEDDSFVLVSMYIDPGHRRKGLGGKLIDAAKEWVKSRPGEYKKRGLLLEVERENTGAIALYKSGGFVELDVEDSDGSGTTWMKLAL